MMNCMTNKDFFNKMNEPAIVLAGLMNYLRDYVKPGMTTNHINNICHEYIVSRNAKPAALNYKGFPKSICTSVNSIVCHGIPNDIVLKNEDILSIDIVIELNGYHADSCITISFGSLLPREQKLIEIAHDSMWNAIYAIKPGCSLFELGSIMQNTAEDVGFNVIRDFCGHGIGKLLHEDPQIPFYACNSSKKTFLQEGMFITIEPMVTMGFPDLKILNDGWSAKMLDNRKTAQFEHTIYVTNNGFHVLTYNDFDKIRQKKQTNII